MRLHPLESAAFSRRTPNSGHQVVDIQRQVRHPALYWMGATLDGRVDATGAVFEGKFMLPGRSRKKRRSKSMRHSCSITFGLSLKDCGPFSDYRRRQVG